MFNIPGLHVTLQGNEFMLMIKEQILTFFGWLDLILAQLTLLTYSLKISIVTVEYLSSTAVGELVSVTYSMKPLGALYSPLTPLEG